MFHTIYKHWFWQKLNGAKTVLCFHLYHNTKWVAFLLYFFIINRANKYVYFNQFMLNSCSCTGLLGGNEKPLAALDLGGGSTQITFVPQEQVGLYMYNIIWFKILVCPLTWVVSLVYNWIIRQMLLKKILCKKAMHNYFFLLSLNFDYETIKYYFIFKSITCTIFNDFTLNYSAA